MWNLHKEPSETISPRMRKMAASFPSGWQLVYHLFVLDRRDYSDRLMGKTPPTTEQSASPHAENSSLSKKRLQNERDLHTSHYQGLFPNAWKVSKCSEPQTVTHVISSISISFNMPYILISIGITEGLKIAKLPGDLEFSLQIS